MALQELDYQTVTQIVKNWSAEQRFNLLQELLSTLAPKAKIQNVNEQESSSLKEKKSTLSQALGLLASDKPAPTDEQVEDWLEARRMEKYG